MHILISRENEHGGAWLKVIKLVVDHQEDGSMTTHWCECTLTEAVELALHRKKNHSPQRSTWAMSSNNHFEIIPRLIGLLHNWCSRY